MATISTSGISAGQIIRAEHLLRVINALNGTSPNDIIITAPTTISGSLSLTGSLSVTGSAIIKGLTTTAQTNVVTYNASTGQFFYTASSALALTGSGASVAGGADTQIQFNSGSALSGSSVFRFIYASSSVLLGSGLSTGLYALAQGNNVTASANFSTANGSGAKATALGAHAEGSNTQATGVYSHAEGRQAVASGDYSHAEGYLTIATGSYSHAEGESSQAIGDYSHAEGFETIASGSYSHAEGDSSISSGNYSHAEGYLTIASGDFSHAEGYQTQAIGLYSHAEGWNTVTSGSYQHVQGQYNISSSAQSAFIIGNGASAGSRSNLVFASGSTFQITGSLQVSGSITGSLFGTASHVVNQLVTSSLIDSYIGTRIFPTSATSNGFAVNRNVNGAVGLVIKNSDTGGNAAYSAVSLSPSGSWYDSGSAFIYFNGGYYISSLQNTGGIYSGANTNILLTNNKDFAVQTGATISTFTTKFKVSGSGNVYISSGSLEVLGSLSQGLQTTASGQYSHAEGSGSVASGSYSHAEGYLSIASGSYSHAEGNGQALGDESHAEGGGIAIGFRSHAEGFTAIAFGDESHAEGLDTIASGSYSHAEGWETIARGNGSHAEGTQTIALGEGSHAEGSVTTSSGSFSHAEGEWTVAIGQSSHAEGYYTQASGFASHAEGLYTVASGSYQHVQGQYNISSSAQSAFIIGNGTSTNTRSNLVFASGSQFQISGSLRVSGSQITTQTGHIGQTLVVGSTTQSQLDGNGYLLLHRGQSNMSFVLGNSDTGQISEIKLDNVVGNHITSSGYLRLSTATESINLTKSGSVEVTGSLLINDVAVLTPRLTTPASPTNGMLIVSGSGADQHIYCYLNSVWKQLD